MEKAIIVNDFRNIKVFKLKSFDRIYYGNEFCPNLLPRVSEIKKNLETLKKINKPFSFLTSYAGNEDLVTYKSAIAYLVKQKIINEIIVNDLGLLNFCRNEYPNLKLVVGRFLTRLSYFGSYESFRVERIEIDSGFFSNARTLSPRNKSNRISFYYPYVVIQGTRYCSLVKSCNGKINPGIVKCQKECLKIGALRLSHSFFKKDIILVGNTQLVKIIAKDEIKKIENIDRTVYQHYDFWR